MVGEDLNPSSLAPESAHHLSRCCLSLSLCLLSSQVEPMEHTKKLLYQYEAMMKLRNEEKLSRHQAWESELEVVPSERGQVGGGRSGECLNLALPYFPIQVLEILKLQEEEDDAHTLAISIYDTKRNEKSKEYREAMVSLVPWPRPWRFLYTPTTNNNQASKVVRMIREAAGGSL